MALSQKGKTKVCGIRPMPRDGHSGLLYGDAMVIFGGDRHHMPFNDMFALDLQSEFDRQSYQFVRDNNSAEDLRSSHQDGVTMS